MHDRAKVYLCRFSQIFDISFWWRHGRLFVKNEAALSRPQFCFNFLEIWYAGSLSQSRKGDCISAFYNNNFYPIWRTKKSKMAAKIKIYEIVQTKCLNVLILTRWVQKYAYLRCLKRHFRSKRGYNVTSRDFQNWPIQKLIDFLDSPWHPEQEYI